MKAVFLDVDGVLNCEKDFKKKSELQLYAPHKSKIKLLNKLVKRYGRDNITFVISSVWRRTWNILHLKILFEVLGFKGKINDSVTPFLPGKQRGEEIQAFIEKYNQKFEDQIDSFVVFDDDSDMSDVLNNFVYVDGYHGLRKIDISEAISILDKKERFLRLFSRLINFID